MEVLWIAFLFSCSSSFYNLPLENEWQVEFTDLRKYNKDGSKAVYTVKEQKVDGYTTKIEGNQDEGYTVTNTSIQAPPSKPDPTKPDPDKPEYKNPKTGDSFSIYIFSIMFVLSGLALYLV
ncbi:MAG: Cna B-type domain-containing protein, partial [Clostridiales bacterium]|nr:Cna B-type domain-containing protein [Clostridiales bacterium]